MKNILKSILLCGTLIVATSCTDLEEDLIGDIVTDVDIAGVDTGGGAGGGGSAISGAFNKLLDTGTANHGGYWSVQSVSTDEMAVTQKGGDWYDGGIWIDMHRHTFTPASGAVNSAWNQQYSGIAECNNALDTGNTLDGNQTAQVMVLRAFFYYRLLDSYGNVKIVTSPGQNPPQSTRSQVFDFVEGQLLEALGITAVTADMDFLNSNLGVEDNPYRVNRYAALGLLAKLYLNAEVYTGTAKYQEAADAASYVIDNSAYVLAGDSYSITNLGRRPAVASDPANLTGYAAMFAPNNEKNPEMIWSVPFDEVTGGGMQYAHMTLHYSSQFTWNIESQPWNGYSALEDFYNSYEDGDKRKTANFIVGPQLDYGGSLVIDYAASDGELELDYTSDVNELEPNASRKGGARLGKFSFKQFQRNNASNDYPVIRLGDLYLIRGEAIARASSNNWSLALNDVNTIRARAGVSAMTSLTADEFLAERGREMFMEVTRRQDLIRFGKFDDSWWEKTNSDAYKSLFPIPQEQITASEGTLTQNPGY